MNKHLMFLLLLLFFLVSCQSVPVTGRQQLSLIPAHTLSAMGSTSYKDFLSKHTVVMHTEQAQMVRRVGKRIQAAVERYFSERAMSARLRGYEWEFNLVDEEAVNAWAMPGGKVVVYKGILGIAKDEAGLAVVIGHEIAHVVANHGNERISQGLLVQMGGVALSVALKEKPKETEQLFLAAFGLGTQVGVLLPFSRLHESEADYLGLIFMAMAGYDPHAAVDFWQAMAAQTKKGASVPEFLSTHPADEARIQNIKRSIPDALEYYRPWN